MNREDILEGLKKVLAPYTPDKEALTSITPETNFIGDLKINSANMVDILIDAEEKYDIEIDMDSAEKIHDVGSCIDVIIEKMNEKA
jgi:acyl carrier protein